jgi:hypothetical protein
MSPTFTELMVAAMSDAAALSAAFYRTQAMALPELVRRAALRQVEPFCMDRVPAQHRDEIRVEFTLRGNAITIVERRPPWRADFGEEWSSLKIAQLRYRPGTGLWSLLWRNRNERWFMYPNIEPSHDVAPLLAEIDADPTGIFWG